MLRYLSALLSALLGALLLAIPGVLTAQSQADPAALLRVQDIRLARIADRIQAANAPLCNTLMPITGMILHSRDQYAEPSADWFANGDFAVAAIVPGSAADAAGLQANDGVFAAAALVLDDLHAEAGMPRRDAAYEAMFNAAQDGRLTLVTHRAGKLQSVTLTVPEGCRSLVEILTSNDIKARSDGRVIQITYGMAAGLSDEQLAAVFSHELAHTVLEHRRRLEEAGVSKGLLGEFGRNRSLNRQVEVEADRLSVHLLANAGYDPAIIPQFWRSDAGQRNAGGILRSRIYPSRRARAELIEDEIRDYLPTGSGPSWPAHLLALRDRPFADN